MRTEYKVVGVPTALHGHVNMPRAIITFGEALNALNEQGWAVVGVLSPSAVLMGRERPDWKDWKPGKPAKGAEE